MVKIIHKFQFGKWAQLNFSGPQEIFQEHQSLAKKSGNMSDANFGFFLMVKRIHKFQFGKWAQLNFSGPQENFTKL